MVRVNLFLDEKRVDYLKNLPSTLSEHLRNAVDEYIWKLENKNATTSLSERGDDNV